MNVLPRASCIAFAQTFLNGLSAQAVAWVAVAFVSSLCGPMNARGQCPFWQLAPAHGHPTGPVAYDSWRNCLVCCSGMQSEGWIDQTWEFSEGSWKVRGYATPPALRSGEAIAFDEARGVTVLFGGLNVGQTWEWDGRSWTQRPGPGPAVRQFASMVYDSSRRVCVMFGGADSTYTGVSETWEWNGQAWSLRATTGPSARYGSAAAFDSARGKVVVFGGYPFDGTTWEWDGSSWTMVASTGPAARRFAGMAYDPARQRTVLFGGEGPVGVSRNDTWEWDGVSWTERNTADSPPLLFNRGRLVYDSSRGAIVAYVGHFYDSSPTEPTVEQLWVYDGQNWHADHFAEPTPRTGAVMVHDPINRTSYMFGGYDGSAHRSETFKRRDSRWNSLKPSGPTPSKRAFGAAAFDAERGVMVLFGGEGPGGTVLGDTWEFNGTTWTLRAQTGPAARKWHSMAYDHARRVTVMVGGWDGGPTVFGDTWEWDGTAWTRRQVPSYLPVRAQPVVVYDRTRAQVVMFGGATGSSFLSDTWVYGGNGWVQVNVQGVAPSPRHYASGCYDLSRSRVVLFGGHDGITRGDTWEWDGSQWQQTQLTGMKERTAACMVFDEAIGAVLAFGGDRYGVPYGDTWEYPRPQPLIEEQLPAEITLPLGASLNLAAGNVGRPNQYQWRSNGVAIPGATYGVLTTSPTADAAIQLRVWNSCGEAFSSSVHISVIPDCYANCDQSTTAPFLNANDFQCFLTRFANREPFANCDNSNWAPVLTANDFQCFINTYASGCP